MEKTIIDPVIATRILESGGQTVRVSIGMPRPDDISNNYFCPIEIVGPITNSRTLVGGVDAVQALWLALEMAGMQLLITEERKAGKLTWLDHLDLGFPLPSRLEYLREKIPETP